jgi:hypothetical protein
MKVARSGLVALLMVALLIMWLQLVAGAVRATVYTQTVSTHTQTQTTLPSLWR